MDSEKNRHVVIDQYQKARWTINYLPNLIKLLDRPYPDQQDDIAHSRTPGFQDKAIVRIILSEDDNQYSSTQRIVLSLEAIQGIYDVVARLHGRENSDLLVLGIDSGSNKLLDLFGFADSIAEAKEIILGLFDRVVFHKQAVVSKNIAAVAESLPVFEKIGQLQSDNKMDREEAELLRRKLITSLKGMLESGTVIPEMNRSVQAEPSLVMRPEPKLLAAPVAIGTTRVASSPDEDVRPDTGPTGVGSSDRLNAEEAAQLKALLEKAGFSRQSRTSRTSSKRSTKPRTKTRRKEGES